MNLFHTFSTQSALTILESWAFRPVVSSHFGFHMAHKGGSTYRLNGSVLTVSFSIAWIQKPSPSQKRTADNYAMPYLWPPCSKSRDMKTASSLRTVFLIRGPFLSLLVVKCMVSLASFLHLVLFYLSSEEVENMGRLSLRSWVQIHVEPRAQSWCV